MQKILHAKAFSVATVKKLQFIQIDFNTLMPGGNKWSDMYYLNEPGVLGIKGSTNSYNLHTVCT